MKKVILFLLFTGGLFGISSAQTAATLAFSQVKLVSSQETVPNGTVWKINNILPTSNLTTVATGTSSGASSATNTTILVNGNSIVLTSSNSRYNYYGYSVAASLTSVFGSIISGPIWLPTGTTLEAGNNVYAISVTEFIIVP